MKQTHSELDEIDEYALAKRMDQQRARDRLHKLLAVISAVADTAAEHLDDIRAMTEPGQLVAYLRGLAEVAVEGHLQQTVTTFEDAWSTAQDIVRQSVSEVPS